MSALIVSFGGGVNSAAMLVGMRERGIVPDAILFADTGGEKPETYEFIQEIRAWLGSGLWCKGFPDLVGLGRRWSWKELVSADEAQFKMFSEVIETPCICFDGETA